MCSYVLTYLYSHISRQWLEAQQLSPVKVYQIDRTPVSEGIPSAALIYDAHLLNFVYASANFSAGDSGIPVLLPGQTQSLIWRCTAPGDFTLMSADLWRFVSESLECYASRVTSFQ